MLNREDLQLISGIIPEKSSVLDLGCGDGVLLQELVEQKQIKALGIEISLERIKSCLEKGVSVVQEDLNEGLKDFQDNSFDFIILSQTLEYIAKPIYFMKEMLRVGKRCIISFENLAYWKNRFAFLFKGDIKSGHSLNSGSNGGGKKQFLTVKKFIELSRVFKFKISKSIFLPQRRFNLTKIFPNLFSRIAVFMLENKI